MARGLGKGFEAIFPEEKVRDEDQVHDIPVNQCRPNPYQPRVDFDDDAIQELKVSIQEHGVLQPIIVRKSIKGYEIVVGERRFRASKLAGHKTVPALVREWTDEQMMELALLENLQREDLTPIEEAKAYQSLQNELGVTQDKLSKRLGKSRSHIANLIRLLSLPSEVIQQINTGKLSMGHGRALLGLKKPEAVLEMANRIEREQLNVRQVERLIQEMNQKKAKKKDNPRDLFLEERENSLKEQLGTSVKIHKGKRKGKIEIEFMNDEDLERILDLFDKE
ncbi:ParB/RepB/Spo0J family partition protein [Halobacillus locisalis]|uniref:ParB/RepB/Spo0J family partition protein n=1 Tax=Halobacillus locisalis TaxID=220753 RepID=A0A838CRI4_9BACI|nr:ParB/RepB/Spo0J family partition protein [Halobacillus locisalis]MBA2174752.1 ParB/RepB/Spo0J family partition protein [Halobacillus locisalis]